MKLQLTDESPITTGFLCQPASGEYWQSCVSDRNSYLLVSNNVQNVLLNDVYTREDARFTTVLMRAHQQTVGHMYHGAGSFGAHHQMAIVKPY